MTREGPAPGGGLLVAVLAGGRGRRLGRDKPSAPVGGVPMVRRVLDAARRSDVGPVVVVGDGGAPDGEGVDRLRDRVPGLGPLGGLHAALHEAARRELAGVLLVGCDLPFVTAETLCRVAGALPGRAAVAPCGPDGRVEAVCSAWSVAVREAVDEAVETRALALQALFRAVGGHALDRPAPGADPEELLNVNTPADLARAVERAADRSAAARDAPSPAGSLPPVVCIVGKKKSGKTTTVVGLVRALRARGRRVMTVKHGHGFRLDREGTDSWRHRHEGGAERVLMAGPEGFALVGSWEEDELPLETLVARHLADAELVVAEGFKASGRPRIEVFREGVHDEPVFGGDPAADALYLAIVTDREGFRPGVPVVDADDPDRFERLADLVEASLGGGGP